MVIAVHELVDRYGAAVDRHVAALFVGAGLSMQARLPSWSSLIRPLAAEIGLLELLDMPLAAEYFVQNTAGGRDRLERHLADELSRVTTPVRDTPGGCWGAGGADRLRRAEDLSTLGQPVVGGRG